MSGTQVFEYAPGTSDDLPIDPDDPLQGEILKLNIAKGMTR